MKLYSPDNSELMVITSLERDGNQLVVKGNVFGAMPIVAKLRPDQARALFALLRPRLFFFLLTLPFRRARQ
jgi:hypothetical protein